MSMAARKSGSATASAGASKTTAKAMPRQPQQDRLERRRRRPDVVGVERGDEQPRAEHGGEQRQRRVGQRGQPRHDGHDEGQPDRARHERRELRRVQLRELRGDEEVGEGGADNG